MQINEALNALNDGHTIWKVGYAKRVCKALGIPFSNKLVEKWHSGGGFIMHEGCEGNLGVDGLGLSEYIAKQVGIYQAAKTFIGCGSQAREYARLVREAFEVKMKAGKPEPLILTKRGQKLMPELVDKGYQLES